ncbi:MAG: DUF6152 family protein [Pyrinomonadaceae bacterium]
MRRKSNIAWSSLCAVVLVTCVTTSSVFAHHGWSSYDASKTLNFTGVIRESNYSNPHGMIRLQVDGKNGKVWLVVLAPTSRMSARGLSQAMLKVGTTVTVVGYPHRERADEMRAERITIDRKTVELR